ncbi:MAG: ATP-binding cassette domain-containing protein [Paracoccaceae bacterium]
MAGKFQSLVLKSVCVKRGGKTLLGPLDLTLETPGITAILGHNGAGKSLFIKLCHGQFAASNGVVLWNGQPAESTRRNRSFMFQDTPLLRRSVAANVEYPLIAYNVVKSERMERVTAALIKARLSDHSDAPAASLSGGEKQRLALARAWVTRPQVILLDEPSASLDPASTKELEGLVQEISATGVKVLMATHDLRQARRLASDVLIFGAGKIIAQEMVPVFFDTEQTGAVADFIEGRL